MSTLRSRLIHLAAENPEMREHLLPLLDEGGKTAVHVNPKGTAGLGALRGKPAKKPVSGTDIRSGYYESGDKITSLEWAVKGDPNTKDDKALLKAVADLQKAHTAVFEALKPYAWD